MAKPAARRGSRLWPRLLVGARVWPQLLASRLWPGRRCKPAQPQRILIAQHLLLGDTIMLAPLLKKLRQHYPQAELVLLCPPAWLPLFAGRPYGVRALAYDVRSLAAHRQLLREGPFDWALVPGDNRWSWIARAMGARWITAFAGDEQPVSKNWPIDEFVAWPEQVTAWGDVATLLAPGAFTATYAPADWPAPPRPLAFTPPPAPYCVLHLGASSPHKHWPPAHWQAAAAWAEAQGLTVVLSAGKGEQALLGAVDPAGKYLAYAGSLDLAGVWHLLAGARLLLCLDTGIAHLARLTGTPTVAMFGPGSPLISGPGRFWQDSPFAAVWVADIPCRDQDLLFERQLPWVRHCWRSVGQCARPLCMEALGVDMVLAEAGRLLARGRP